MVVGSFVCSFVASDSKPDNKAVFLIMYSDNLLVNLNTKSIVCSTENLTWRQQIHFYQVIYMKCKRNKLCCEEKLLKGVCVFSLVCSPNFPQLSIQFIILGYQLLTNISIFLLCVQRKKGVRPFLFYSDLKALHLFVFLYSSFFLLQNVSN